MHIAHLNNHKIKVVIEGIVYHTSNIMTLYISSSVGSHQFLGHGHMVQGRGQVD